ncbi:hypothetical protein [Enterobacter ludwigii]|uniref:hypothetical protein n=1 Tax=Enterobacter ludwigii TaxID=299767 RepID=UPI003976314A
MDTYPAQAAYLCMKTLGETLMYIGPTLTDVTTVSDNKVLMRESLINSVKKDVENHRTLFDRFVDFFKSENSVRNKYAARTEDTMKEFLTDICRDFNKAVITKLEGNAWKVSFRGSDYQISYITTLDPNTNNLAENLLRTMIDTGTARPPDTPPVKPFVEYFHISGTVCGWDSPYSVKLRATPVGKDIYTFDDGVNCYCPPTRTLPFDTLVQIIVHCLHFGLSPVEAQIVQHSDKEKVDIGVSTDKRRGAEARSFVRFMLKKDHPPRVSLKDNGMDIKRLIGRVRPQNVDVVLTRVETSGAELYAMLNDVKESFCITRKEMTGDQIGYLITFDLGNGCTAEATYIVKPNDNTSDLDSLLASKSKNLTDPLIKAELEIDQVFDDDDTIENFIDTQIESLIGLLKTERTMNAVMRQQNKAHQTVTLTDTTGGEPVIFNKVSARRSTAGEGRGAVLINALLDACEEATTNADGTTMYKNISTARLKESLVNSINNCERRKLQSEST